jgi:uncharacterized hydrophobic protein (TIGR00271 family)
MKDVLTALNRFISQLFNLHEDKAEEKEIIESIKRNVSFRGTNLWTLIFAILIASIGLNMNATAVIIGAMLISPLMGPIMAIGLAIGVYDFDLLKRGIKNIVIAATISIFTSYLYFLITPLHEAKSELLARTTPSIWDVLIAFLGGLAGIVAGTRREKGNVIPGVAIATALMPPLCTAGFGLASGQWFYFLGALYLFFINSLFICLATLVIVRYLNFNKIEFPTEARKRRVVRSVWVMVILTILPSLYLTWRIVQRTIFEENARRFLQNEFSFGQTQIVNRNFKFDHRKPAIEVLLIGQELTEQMIDSLSQRRTLYNLGNADVIVRQGLDAKNEIDLAQIKASILEDVYSGSANKKDSLPAVSENSFKDFARLKAELKSLYPNIRYYSFSEAVIRHVDSARTDTVTLFYARFSQRLSTRERARLASWLKQRVQADSIKLMVE